MLRIAIAALCLIAWTGSSTLPVHAAGDACAAPPYGGLDFWLGSWSVHSDDPAATSRIERLGAGCAVLESYREPGGYGGKSLNYVDPRDHAWHQVWLDSTGALSQFVGVLRPGGGIDFTGETRRPRGDSAHRRMSLSPEGLGNVRQLSVVSFDQGATWKPHYSLEYRPAVEPAPAGPCEAPGDPGAEQAVRTVTAALAAAENAQDPARALALYEPGAVLLPPGEAPSIEVRPRRSLAAERATFESHVDRICVAGPVALVEGHETGPHLDDQTWTLLRKDDAGWRISVRAWRPRPASAHARG